MGDRPGAGDKLVRQKEASGAVLSQIEVDLVRNQLQSCDTSDWVKRPSSLFAVQMCQLIRLRNEERRGFVRRWLLYIPSRRSLANT